MCPFGDTNDTQAVTPRLQEVVPGELGAQAAMDGTVVWLVDTGQCCEVHGMSMQFVAIEQLT